MQKMRDAIKEMNEKAEVMEKSKVETYHTLCRTTGKQHALKQRIEDTEEEIEKVEKRKKEMEHRAGEKELFLKESRDFNTSLQVVACDEGAVETKEAELRLHKDLYNKNYERYQLNKAKKIELEQKFELVECKSQEMERRLNALKLELEYNLVEEGRRSEGCKDSIDAAFRTEKSYLDLQRGLDVVMKRKEKATKRINELEAQINRSEETLETTNFERRRIEATIREVLLSAKSQYSDL